MKQQTEQAWCLTLVTNSVVAWATEFYGLAVDSMRATGWRVDDEVLAQLGPTGFRPDLRSCMIHCLLSTGRLAESGDGPAPGRPVTVMRR
ncbi:Tn3 family transposase [Nonomuraea sp. NPDC004186]